MKIVIAGGHGQLGILLVRHFADDHDLVILSRSDRPHTNSNVKTVQWNGKSVGDWSQEIDGADVVINLAGRTVNCRYNAANRKQILDSRVESTRALGQAICKSANPPRLWLQSSTATIYAHRFDKANDEESGIIGGSEEDVPETWNFSIDVAKAWEAAANEWQLDRTRLVLMRTAMVMSPDPESVFDVLMGLVCKRLGGANGNGRQFVSWIHEHDFTAAVGHLIENEHLNGPVNLASPNPLPNRQFMKQLRQVAGVSIGLPATKWMLEVGAFFLKTETELILKSRRVVPGELQKSGFKFEYPEWQHASQELYARWKSSDRVAS